MSELRRAATGEANARLTGSTFARFGTAVPTWSGAGPSRNTVDDAFCNVPGDPTNGPIKV